MRQGVNNDTMGTRWPARGHEPATGEAPPGSFEAHRELMRKFRLSHPPPGPGESPGTPENRHAATESVTPEWHRTLPMLLKFGYVLNLIRERGTPLLPRNWQN